MRSGELLLRSRKRMELLSNRSSNDINIAQKQRIARHKMPMDMVRSMHGYDNAMGENLVVSECDCGIIM
uniref:DNA-directed RNA polymerase n=1 Tax=Ascaris lumbricoides TaxID=6252 RepID=A0A0M3HSV5_ASCLU